MRNNPVKDRLAAGGNSFGTMVFEFSTTGIARLAAAAGAEFVIFDMEHNGWTSETIRTLLASSGGADIVPMVRVPANQYHLIATALDLGAMGIMVPMVETADAAAHVVASTKYPPEGRRGAAFAIAHDDYRAGDIGDKIAAANEGVVTIAQIETAVGVENVEEIAAVEGLDMLWMGQFDLTNFLGVPGRFDDPAFRDAVARIVAAANRNGLILGALALTVDEARGWIEAGFRCIAYGGDLWLYQRALSHGLTQLKGEASS